MKRAICAAAMAAMFLGGCSSAPRRGTMCAAQPMPDDSALAAHGVRPTACESRALRETFCTALAARPDHDPAGIAPGWIAEMIRATGDGQARAVFLTEGYYNAAVDGKTSPGCGFQIRGVRAAPE